MLKLSSAALAAALLLSGGEAAAATVSVGKTYTIHGRHSNMCLAVVGGQPQGVKCGPGTSQQWSFIRVAGVANTYMLKSMANPQANLCLMSNAQLDNGVLHMNTCTAAWWAAHWKLTSQDSVHFEIRNRHSNFCLNSPNTTAETSLDKSACQQGWWSQHWEPLLAPSTNLSWSPMIDNDCHVYIDRETTDRQPGGPSPNCDANAQHGKPYAWTIANYNEADDGAFTPQDPIPHNLIGEGGMLDVEFVPKANGRFSLSLGLDKITFGNSRDSYTWVGLSDNFDWNWTLDKPTFAQNLYIDFKMAIPAALRQIENGVPGMSRVHIGVSARQANDPQNPADDWSYFMEVVLWRHEEYDGCTPTENWWGQHPATPCDSTGLYDRRSTWGNGEAVYYYAPGLNQLLGYWTPALVPGGEALNYRIPLTKLFRGYQWHNMPASWGDVEIGGVYIGIETQGKAVTWFELDDYRLYEVGQ